MKIHKTTDYTQFKTIKNNREILKSHIKNIVESIKEVNLLENNPILVNKEMEVLDGQHRLLAAKELKVPIFYTIIKGESGDAVRLINANLKHWSSPDYVRYFVGKGLPDYILIKDFMEKYGFSVSLSIAILSGKTIGMARSKYPRFKRGLFQVDDVVFSREIARKVLEIAPYTSDKCWKNRDFVEAIVKFTVSDLVPFEVLVSKLKSSKQKITQTIGSRNFLRQFELVLNWHRQKDENYIRLI